MKKRNLRPQQAAPVARETTATSDQQGEVTPLGLGCGWPGCYPFAGDDAK
ncbi:MAG: anacyclamide/piricyclamide family prenylated cyclic peptide [Gloeotrichia echinulata GP01]